MKIHNKLYSRWEEITPREYAKTYEWEEITPREYAKEYAGASKSKNLIKFGIERELRHKTDLQATSDEYQELADILHKISCIRGSLADSLEERMNKLELDYDSFAGYLNIPDITLRKIRNGQKVNKRDMLEIIVKYPELDSQVTEYARDTR